MLPALATLNTRIPDSAGVVSARLTPVSHPRGGTYTHARAHLLGPARGHAVLGNLEGRSVWARERQRGEMAPGVCARAHSRRFDAVRTQSGTAASHVSSPRRSSASVQNLHRVGGALAGVGPAACPSSYHGLKIRSEIPARYVSPPRSTHAATSGANTRTAMAMRAAIVSSWNTLWLAGF